MGKKDKKKKDKPLRPKRLTDEETQQIIDEWDSAKYNDNVYQSYTNFDSAVSSIIQNLRERMAEAAAAELDCRTFINECANIGARAVFLGGYLDSFQEGLDRMKPGMNRADADGSKHDTQEEACVSGTADRPQQ